MSTKVFLGLVTHRHTRFPDSDGPGGFVQSAARLLETRGFAVTTRTHDEDAYSASLLPLTREEVRASIDAELSVESDWRLYVQHDLSPRRLAAMMRIRRAYRHFRFAPPWRGALPVDADGPRMLRRLVNIELAHLSLLNDAIASEADWALIVEDDAHVADTEAFGLALAGFLESVEGLSQPSYVNLSRSFSEATLGLAPHLADAGPWGDSARVLSADRPLTNTVCAILYRREFLLQLADALAGIPLSPVLPIDWKLNLALMGMHSNGLLGSGDCWFVSPAPIVQGSMHATSHG